MKKRSLLGISLATIAFCAVLLHAAQGPAVVEKPQLASFNALPLYDDAGTLITFQVTAKFKVKMLMPDGKASRYHIRSVEFDLVQQGSQSIVIGNELVELQDIGADIQALSEFVWKMNNPDPLPTNPKPIVRRKAAVQKAVKEEEDNSGKRKALRSP